MHIPHQALVAVADGRKMLFLRNEGDDVHPNLVLERKREQDNPGDGEQSTDRPGRSFSSVGPGRSAYEETDFHQLAEDRFAAETAELLKARALRQDYEALIIVAPPSTLGELRQHYHKEVETRLTGEIAKTLTGHPIDQIEQILLDA
jgi:protein required for attachment to host cells